MDSRYDPSPSDMKCQYEYRVASIPRYNMAGGETRWQIAIPIFCVGVGPRQDLERDHRVDRDANGTGQL